METCCDWLLVDEPDGALLLTPSPSSITQRRWGQLLLSLLLAAFLYVAVQSLSGLAHGSTTSLAVMLFGRITWIIMTLSTVVLIFQLGRRRPEWRARANVMEKWSRGRCRQRFENCELALRSGSGNGGWDLYVWPVDGAVAIGSGSLHQATALGEILAEVTGWRLVRR